MTQTMTAPRTEEARERFLKLTPGKLAGLRRITDERQRFKVLALDQSNSFKKSLRAMNEKSGSPAEPDYAQIGAVKLEMTRILGAHAGAVLLDVNFAARQAQNSMALPKGVGLIVRLEASKDPGLAAEYERGWSVEAIKRMGADAVKLLVYLDAESPANVSAQMRFVEEVSRACEEQDILLMTEELSFPRKGEEKSSPSYKKRKVGNILEAARLIGPYTDILKLEFPGHIQEDSPSKIQDNLGRLDEIASRPWVLLSAGEKFDLFIRQAELAMKAGCSGYMAGRAIFNESFEDAKTQKKFLETTGVERMEKLNRVVEESARGWMERYRLSAKDLAGAVESDWYLKSDPRPESHGCGEASTHGRKSEHSHGGCGCAEEPSARGESHGHSHGGCGSGGCGCESGGGCGCGRNELEESHGGCGCGSGGCGSGGDY